MDDPLKSPPSSPEGVSPTTRKRSHEEMKGEATETQESNSSTTVGDADAASIQNKQNKNETSSLSSTIKPSTQASNMPPPSVPASKMSSQQPPRSGQGSTTNSQSSQPGIKTKNVTDSSAVERKADTDADGDSSTDDDEEEEEELDSPTLSEPHEQIEMFDWDDLQQRYHDKTRQLDSEEATIMDEFHALCDYFAVWAESGSTHEVDRSFKRMKTQMTLVKHHEDQLEEKRQHYVKVVDAFKRALDLLIR